MESGERGGKKNLASLGGKSFGEYLLPVKEFFWNDLFGCDVCFQEGWVVSYLDY